MITAHIAQTSKPVCPHCGPSEHMPCSVLLPSNVEFELPVLGSTIFIYVRNTDVAHYCLLLKTFHSFGNKRIFIPSEQLLFQETECRSQPLIRADMCPLQRIYITAMPSVLFVNTVVNFVYITN